MREAIAVIRGASDRHGQDRGPGPRRERRRPGRQGRPAPEEPDGDPVGSIAPVDEEHEQLAPPEDPEDLADVPPVDRPDPPPGPLLGQVLEQLGQGRVVGEAGDREAAVGQGGRRSLVVADVGDGDDQAPARRPPERLELVEPIVLEQLDDLVERARGQPHQLDDVRPVGPVGVEGQAPDGRVAGFAPEDPSVVEVDEATLRRPGQVRGLEDPADDGPGRPLRHPAEDGGGPAVGGDRRALGEPREALRAASVRRLERRPVARHLAAAAAFTFGAATFLSLRSAGASVPTSVSSSSPRMNASTRAWAMSSWICSGGLFMK